MKKKNQKSILAWWRSQDGAVLPLVGLVFGVLVLSAGFTIDYTRAQIVRERLQWALDAGALAGAKVAGQGQAAVQREANDYFRANFPPGYMGTVGGTMAATPISPVGGSGYGYQFQVNGMQMRSYVMKAFGGMQNIGVNALAEVNTTAPKFADVVFAIDVSGSMDVTANRGCVIMPYGASCYNGTAKLEVAKTAMRNMVDTLSGAGVHFGLVPFSNAVNLENTVIGVTPTNTCSSRGENPANRIALLASESASQSLVNAGNASFYQGNPAARPCYYFNRGATYDGETILRAGSLHPIQYFTNNRNTILTAINRQQPHGNTDASLGMYWAYRMFVPGSIAWRNSRVPSADKAIILLSDGVNTFGYDGVGFVDGNAGKRAQVNQKQLQWCNAAKAAGIDVYTIAYDMQSGTGVPDAKQTLENCASVSSKCSSEPHNRCYFDASNDAALLAAFNRISDAMMTMRLTR